MKGRAPENDDMLDECLIGNLIVTLGLKVVTKKKRGKSF